MAVSKTCTTCGVSFIGRADAKACSTACRLRAHRGGKGRSETDTETATRPAESARLTTSGVERVHSAQAVALLESLAADLRQSAEDLGLSVDQELGWSAQEQATLEAIACTVDRHVDLWDRYHGTDDTALRLKLSTELRLLDGTLSGLLKQVKTVLPAKPSRVSQKATQAAETRWRGAGS